VVSMYVTIMTSAVLEPQPYGAMGSQLFLNVIHIVRQRKSFTKLQHVKGTRDISICSEDHRQPSHKLCIGSKDSKSGVALMEVTSRK